ncbi:Oxysterol-binding protein 3, partial [Spiromyces aspiralis]
MEEYEILPRDSYQHTVTIHETPRVISWWFTTRRKNIDFGLFYRAFDHNGANNNQHQSYQQQSAEGPCASATPNLSSAALANGSDSVANVDATADTGSTLQVHKSTQPEASSVGSRFNSQQGRRGSKLRDPLLVPLLPMAHVESSKGTIKGQWNAIWPGTYILYFDNSFSVSTSKLLTLVVAINEPTKPAEAIPSPVRYEGWLQKKKRKRMQGWARRWVSIRGNYLTYSLAPQGVARAKINLHNAVVSTDTQHHIIYIDGDEGFMQFKAKEMGEFHSWVDAINSVKACKDDLRREEGDTMSIKDGATAVAALPSIPLAQQPPLLPFVRGATPSTPVEIGTVVANWQEGGEDGTGSKTVQQIHSRFTIEATQA